MSISCAVIIPSLNPDHRLKALAAALQSYDFAHIIVVDDGSDSAHKVNFPISTDRLTLLVHEVNRGKVAALKTAMQYVLEKHPEVKGIVTADGDGQHLPRDIAACAEVMLEEGCFVLGVRDFDLPEVPDRSKFGNCMTSFIFRTACGIKISDTQTGLRAIPREQHARWCEVEGDRYEFETNQLLALGKEKLPFREVKIETVYLDENRASHFHPIRDSLRIYARILRFLAGSLFSSLLDICVFYLASLLLGGMLGKAAEMVCTVIARVISSLFNFTYNYKAVFGAKGSAASSMLRYYILAAAQMLASGGILTLLSMLLGAENPAAVTLLKILTDSTLFVISYQIQQRWVFKK